MIKRVSITYNQYGIIVEQLCSGIQRIISHKNIKIDGVYGPPRGGLPIAVHLSHYFNIPIAKIDDICDSEDCSFNTITNIIICDDICDSGKTFDNISRFKKNGINLIFGALFIKPRSTFNPDYFCECVKDDDWIIFPWENLEDGPDKSYMF